MVLHGHKCYKEKGKAKEESEVPRSAYFCSFIQEIFATVCQGGVAVNRMHPVTSLLELMV